MQKNSLVMPAIYLCLICLITTGLVALTYNLTLTARELQAQIAANASRRLVAPEAADFIPVEFDPSEAPAGLREVYKAVNEDGFAIAFILVSGSRGYSGQVPVMLAINSDREISGIRVLKNDETPGLGKKVANDAFTRQFLGQSADASFAVVSPGSAQIAIDSVSGATVSSQAVTQAVNIAVDYFRNTLAEVIAHGS